MAKSYDERIADTKLKIRRSEHNFGLSMVPECHLTCITQHLVSEF